MKTITPDAHKGMQIMIMSRGAYVASYIGCTFITVNYSSCAIQSLFIMYAVKCNSMCIYAQLV